MMAYRVFHDIVMKADYFLDCHGSDIHETNIWSFIYYATDDEVEKKSEDIARVSGITYLSRSKYPGGMGQEAAERGVPGGLFELCAGDRLLPEESQAIIDASFNVMIHLGMLEGEIKEITEQPGTTEGQKQELWKPGVSSYFTKAGLYHVKVKAGDVVTKGQVVGTVTNFWGEVIETIYAPATGRIGGSIHNPVANPGDTAIGVHPS
jgi:predicted deacylase